MDGTKIVREQIPDDEFEVLEEEQLSGVNELKRFVRAFFRRKIVVVGFILVVVVLLTAALADVIAPYDPYEQDLYQVLAAPGPSHPLGTDALGRDLLSRIIHGSRIALAVGVCTVLVSASIGTVIGLIAGFSDSRLNSLIMRITDILISVPSLVLQLLIASALNSGVTGVVIAIGLTLFPAYIRLINGQVLSVKQNDYISASRSMGAKKSRIIVRHVVRNVVSPLIVMMTIMMGMSIMAEAGLSFLGLGILPPAAAWGSMCRDGYQYLMTRPLLSIAPGLAIMILVFAFNMVGDGLRDALDPKLRGALK
ncbi:peptide/nickel transport system permease protein [Sporobacter termitidis DSM 10068]|uniref:Peptide/nickel transport system permease protein n=1 Tax=Sporobacter termitidis DSM 10068 TaxID=1123282 RepID=A0A1M5XSQ4_9FIRM|nr:ABC transporter permease [Sporobacter termitidis]SHI02840.1 peptide/nickel transport system permease protein [Sporobacter termitidis DSM 10068]